MLSPYTIIFGGARLWHEYKKEKKEQDRLKVAREVQKQKETERKARGFTYEHDEVAYNQQQMVEKRQKEYWARQQRNNNNNN